MGKLNLESLKSSFIAYLQNKGMLKDEDLNNINQLSFSIFKYAKEFQEYLKTEMAGEKDLNSLTITDILTMNIGNKTSTEPEETEGLEQAEEAGETENSEQPEQIEQTEETQETQENDKDETSESDEEQETKEDNILVQIFNDLLEDEEFFNAIDKDNSKEISKEEMANFLDLIKNMDENAEDISYEDILGAAAAIADGKSLEQKTEESSTEETEEAEEPKEDAMTTDETNSDTTDTTDTTNADTPSETGNNSDGGISGDNGNVSDGGNVNNNNNNNNNGPNNTDNNDSNKDTETKPKSLEQMTETELKAELSNAQTDLDAKQKNLNSIMDGSDATLAALKEEEKKAYEAYQTELKNIEPAMAEELEKITGKISEKDTEINNQEKIISASEQSISNLNAEKSTAETTVSSLDASLKKLKGTDTKDLTSEQLSDLDAKKANAESQLNSAKDRVKDIEKKIKAEEENLNNQNNNLNKLKTEKDELNTKKNELEKQIAEKHTDISKLIEAYNSAQKAYDEKKSEMITSAKESVTAALKRVQEINTAISKVDNDKNIKDNLTFSTSKTLDDIFDGSVKGYEMKKYVYNGRAYFAYVPDNLDPNEEVPMAVYMHGYGERNDRGNWYSDDNMYKALKNMESNSSYKNFKGIILFPQARSNACWDDKNELAMLDGTINDFLKNSGYNINEDKVSLMGYSNGGGGVGLYYNYPGRTVKIHRAAVLAGYFINNFDSMYNNLGEGNVRVYTGNKDGNLSPGRYRERARQKGLPEKDNVLLDGVGHGGTPAAALFRDGTEEAKNGRSDLLEFLFGG